METTLEEFRKQAAEHGICGMAADWDKCKSKKQLIDLALSIRGIEYIAKSIAEGWGVSPKYISNEFASFNGKYVRDKDGYTSMMYCGVGTKRDRIDITAMQSALLLIDVVADVIVPANRICEVHAVNSELNFKGGGVVRFKAYGDTVMQKSKIRVEKL